MTLEELKKYYSNSAQTQDIIASLKVPGSKVFLKGTLGSSNAFIASSIIDKIQGTHIFILPDKEDAVYFMNDLNK